MWEWTWPSPAPYASRQRKSVQFGITFAPVEERFLEARVRTVGVVEADETRLPEITTKFSGYVEHLYAAQCARLVPPGRHL